MIIRARHGREAAEAVVRLVRESAPGTPITVIAPSPDSAMHLRRLCAGALGARFTTLQQTAVLLGASHLPPGRIRLTPFAAAEAAAAALRGEGLGTSAQSVQAYVRTLSDIRESPGEARQVEDPGLGRVYRTWRGLIEPSFHDRCDLVKSAMRSLDERSPTAAELGRVILFLPSRHEGIDGALLRSLEALPGFVMVEGTVEDNPPEAAGCGVYVEPEDEVRAAVARALEWANEGIPFSRTAFLAPLGSGLLATAASAFVQAGIPIHARITPTLGTTPQGRVLAGLAALRGGPLARRDVMDWAASAPLAWEGASVDASAWEALALKARVSRGRGQWKRRLGLLKDPEADRLARFIDWLDAFTLQSWSSWKEAGAGIKAAWLSLLDQNAAGEDDAEWTGMISDGLDEAEAADLLGLAPDEEGLIRLTDAVLSRRLVPRTGYGKGVFLGDPVEAVGLEFDAVTLAGLVEGAFPAASSDDPILPDRLRGKGLRRRGLGMDEQRSIWLAARMAAPRVFLSMARADRRSDRLSLPSPWLLEEAERLSGMPKIFGEDFLRLSPSEWLDAPASHEEALTHGRPVTGPEHHQQFLLVGHPHPESEASAFARSRFLTAGRGSADLTVYDGLAGPAPAPLTYSASGLETLASCPLRWFLEKRLRLGERDEPGEDEAVSSRDRGDLLHRILKRHVDEGKEIHDPEARTQLIGQIAAEEIERFESEKPTVPEPLWAAEKERLVQALQQLPLEEERLLPGGEPRGTEEEFNIAGLDIGEGRTIHARGIVDRWDLLEDGAARVVDYKAAKPDSYVVKNDPLKGGSRLQVPFYQLVIQQVHGAAASPMSCYVGLDLKGQKWWKREPGLTDQEWPAFLENLRTLDEMARCGVHPAHPGQENCRWCPLTLCCPASKEEEAERKSGDALIQPWRLLAEKTKRQHGSSKAESCEARSAPEAVVPEAEDDEEARKAIAGDLDRSLLVEAGAGTGKTTALVGRIIALVTRDEKPVELSRLTAITFTKKAAGELKERLRREIETRLRLEPSQRLQKALEELDAAAIDTIHGFCRRILAQKPLESGLPPSFSVIEDAAARGQFDDWWRTVLDEMLEDPSLAAAWRSLLSVGSGTGHLKDFARKLNERWDLATQVSQHILTGMEEPVRELLEVLNQAPNVEGARRACRDPKDKLLAWIEETGVASMAIRAALGGNPDLWLPLVMKREVSTPGSKGIQANWKDLAVWRSSCGGYAEAFKHWQAKWTGPLILQPAMPLIVRLADGLADYAQRRQAKGELLLQDLPILAARLLRDRPDVRQELRGRFEAVFVDEFQDTDRLQVELLDLLTTDESGEVPGGKLFLVGDPKQSIYRFRGADVSVYLEVKERMAALGGILGLTTNFRSRREVLALVNQATAGGLRLGVERAEPLGWPKDRMESQEAASVHVLGGPRQMEDAQAEALRRSEAEDIASWILNALARPWQTEVKGTGELRPLKLRDMAILIRSRASLNSLTRALDAAGIPSRIDSRELLLSSPDVRDLVTALTAIDDPGHAAAVVGALRSPLFGCSDRDLAQWNGSWDPRLVKAAEEGPAAEGLRLLAELHSMRFAATAGELVEQAVQKLQAMEKAAAQPRARDRLRRLRLLTAMAREHEEGSLRGFLSALRSMEEAGQDRPVSLVDEPDDDAVRIMTIHAAKGLEFPAAILAGLGGARSDSESVRFWWHEGRPEFRLGANGPATALAGELAGSDKHLQEEEANRLLYVAATRARDHLVLCLHHKAETASMASSLHACLTREQQKEEALQPLKPLARPRPKAELESLETWKMGQAQRLFRGRVPAILTPSRLAALSEEEDEAKAEWRTARRRGGPDLGRAVHGVLQRLDLRSPLDGFDRLCQVQAEAEGQSEAEVRRLVKRALECGPVQEAAGLRHLREAFVSAEIEGALLEGYLDLIAWRPDGSCLIVDYKTDWVRNEAEARERMRKYEIQAAAYSLMVEASTGRSDADVRFIFVRLGWEGSAESANLAAARDRVRTMAREAGTAGLPKTPFGSI